MGERVLGIGVVGCGRAAEALHLPALAKVPRAQVVAACDVHPPTLARVAEAFGVERRHATVEALVADPAVDVVLVATPPAHHVDAALTALAAGRHVLVEKPLAAQAREAERLAAAATDADVVTAVGFNLRCHRLVEQARALVRAGAVGEVRAVRSCWTAGHGRDRALPGWRLDRASGGGVLGELASHHVDLWRHLLGDEPTEVAVLSADGEQHDERAALAARTRHGVVLSATFSDAVVDGNELEVIGTDGRLALSLYRSDSLSLLRRERQHGAGARVRALAGRARALPATVAASRRGGDFIDSYRLEWERFVDAVEGRRPVPATWADGLAVARVVDAARRSAATGATVALEGDA